jgi:hypothetical protein
MLKRCPNIIAIMGADIITVPKLLEILNQQTLINGLPELYDALKTTLRCLGTVTTEDLKLKIFAEIKSKEYIGAVELSAHAVSVASKPAVRPTRMS